MPAFTVQFYTEMNENLHPGRAITIHEPDVDAARKAARKLAKEHGLPAVRTVSVGPNGALHVYCAHNEQSAEPVDGLRSRWKRPPGPPRL